jgi:hypothetical protein
MSCFLSYTSSITGDCSNANLGAFTIEIDGTAPNYTIQWLSPTTGSTLLGVGVTSYTQTNLSAGTYSFNVVDSCFPTNTILPINIFISNGTFVSVTNIEDTICGSNNGSLTATTSNFYGNSSFSLYNNITGLITTVSPNYNSYVFSNISSGTYYVIADDGGGCTGKSESVIIKNSNNLSFGFYKINNAGCSVDSGKIFITGLTGTPPYTYLWSNGGITDSITGLTGGSYTVTVTDNTGCSISDGTVIYDVEPVGLGALYLTQPSCFTADGEVQIIINGGTAPFYYLGSNGVTNITFDRTVTFTGLGPGGFTIQVTDAGLCNFSTSTKLLTPKGMSTINVEITNSKCNDFSGLIGPITVFGGTSPYTYSLTDSSGNIKTNTVYQSNWLFDGLSADTYTLSITDNGSCSFTSAYTINNTILFDLTTFTTGTTCNGSNGSVRLEITSGGTPPYLYEINGSTIKTSLTSYTFNNLTSGNYTASVTDRLFCKQSHPFTIDNSNTVDFHLLSTNSLDNDGSITAYITNGQPPFILYWSGNVGGQTGLTVNNLSVGDYSLRVVDDNGCSKSKKISIGGSSRYGSTGYFNVGSSNQFNQPIFVESTPKQLLSEGYNQIILDSPGNTNCILSAATFQVFVYVGSYTNSSVFYNSTGLLDYPSDELWYNTVQTLLESLPSIGSVSINSITNTIVVESNNEDTSVSNSEISVVMRIDYEIECVCPVPTPTPTNTPTNTVTPTVTRTPGLSPTLTPTVTNTPTVTRTVTPSVTPTTTPTMTVTPSTKIMYYVYLECGTNNEIKNNVVIQPVPAIPTNVVGNVIFDSKNSICWELVNISDNLSQLQNIYQYNAYYNSNYFTEVYGTIFSNSKGKTACGECDNYVKGLEVMSIPKCDFNIRNWSNCVDSNTQGEIYVNDVTVYSFNQSFDSNLYTSNLTVNNGDSIRIHLIVPLESTITLNTELTSGNETRTITNEDFTLNLIVNCSEKTQKIDIFSTCIG